MFTGDFTDLASLTAPTLLLLAPIVPLCLQLNQLKQYNRQRGPETPQKKTVGMFVNNLQ